MNLFDVERGLPVINKPWVRTVKEFNILLTRIRRCNRDSDGVKKLFNLAELCYVFYMEDWNSPFITYPEKERHDKAVISARITEIFSSTRVRYWKPDDEVINARDRYREMMLDMHPSLRLVLELKRGMALSTEVAVMLNDRMVKVLKEYKEETDPDKMGESASLAKSCIEDILDITNKLPKTSKVLADLETDIQKTIDNVNRARGGHTIGDRANPRSSPPKTRKTKV